MPGAAMSVIAAGFYGKLPARGDFVSLGLPRSFVESWDRWLTECMAASQGSLGDDWLAAFLEAPVWRFVLPAGACGEHAVLGLMLPSVDKAGRYFPMSFAALMAGPDIDPASGAAWLDRCEEAGRSALDRDDDPDRVMASIGRPALSQAAEGTRHAEWWTAGSPRLPATRQSMRGLPDPSSFAAMLGGVAAETRREQTQPAPAERTQTPPVQAQSAPTRDEPTQPEPATPGATGQNETPPAGVLPPDETQPERTQPEQTA
jgi:type VI secretion system protein ImpM